MVKDSPIATNATITIPSIVITTGTTTTTYTNVTMTISAGATQNVTPYGGSQHTYYGAWLSFTYGGSTKTFTPSPGTYAHSTVNFTVTGG